MKRASLEEIAQRLRDAGFPPAFTASESRLLVQIVRRLARGQPVTPAEIEHLALHARLAPDPALALVNKISEHDEDGNVQGLMGLSLNGHRHRFEVNGQGLSTWCAWDTLFLPPLLQRAARVESSCPATKRPIRLTIGPERVQSYEPAEAVVSMVTPNTNSDDLRSVDQTWRLFCHHVHYFASAEAADSWFVGRQLDPIILSIEEAYELGRLAFSNMIGLGG